MKYSNFEQDLETMTKVKPHIDSYNHILNSINYLKNFLDNFGLRDNPVVTSIQFPSAEYCRNDNLVLQLDISEALEILNKSLNKQKEYLKLQGITFDD